MAVRHGSLSMLRSPLSPISCFTTDQCTAVGGTGIVGTTDGSIWTAQTPPPETDSLNSVSCPDQAECVAVGMVGLKPSIIGETDNMAWGVLNQPVVQALTAVSCNLGANLHGYRDWFCRWAINP